MKRNLMKDLIEWKDKINHDPMLLLGARQVGKTYLIQEFAREQYEDSIYINFELSPQMRSIFDLDLDPERIIKEIELTYMKKINPDKTLIIFDEIQIELKAVTALKYFSEHEIGFHVIGAGSLLGVAINREEFSFPVGKVEFKYLYPFTLDEFLSGTGMGMYVESIKECYDKNKKMPDAVHEKLVEVYRHYLYVGGMPAAINEYIKCGKDIVTFNRDVHRNIVNSYLADMSKYTSSSEVMKVQAIYKSIPEQMAGTSKKFKYSIIEKGAKALTYGSSIEWLIMSQVSIECSMINRGEIPLSVYKEKKSFKLFFSDVGLLMTLINIPYVTISRENEHNLFKGAVTENYVAQQLKAKGHELYYWKNKNNEVDFIVQQEDKVIPVEVKASTNKRSRSLKEYIRQYNPEWSIRISAKNFGLAEGIKSVPLYAVFCLDISK